MTLLVLDAMCGWFVMKEMPLMALSLRVALFGLLRPGELLNLKAKDVFLPSPKDQRCCLCSAGSRRERDAARRVSVAGTVPMEANCSFS